MDDKPKINILMSKINRQKRSSLSLDKHYQWLSVVIIIIVSLIIMITKRIKYSKNLQYFYLIFSDIKKLTFGLSIILYAFRLSGSKVCGFLHF